MNEKEKDALKREVSVLFSKQHGIAKNNDIKSICLGLMNITGNIQTFEGDAFFVIKLITCAEILLNAYELSGDKEEQQEFLDKFNNLRQDDENE